MLAWGELPTAHTHGNLCYPPMLDSKLAEGGGRGVKYTPFPATAASLEYGTPTKGGVVSNNPCTTDNAVVYRPGQAANVTWHIAVPHGTEPGVRIALRYGPGEKYTVRHRAAQVTASRPSSFCCCHRRFFPLFSSVHSSSSSSCSSPDAAQVLNMIDQTTMAQRIAENITHDNSGRLAGGRGLHTITISIPPGRESASAQLQWMWQSKLDGGYYQGKQPRTKPQHMASVRLFDSCARGHWRGLQTVWASRLC